jgi:4-hydroxy-2-oxoheptanedioate aldolase
MIMPRHQSLRSRLQAVEPLITTFSVIPCIEIVELVALAGFEAIILDLEHGPYGIEMLKGLVVAARGKGIFPIARVRRNEASLIGAVLDSGAAGVIVPQIDSPASARAAVGAARFAPQGTRGANPWVRAADYGGSTEWFDRANDEVAAIVMIEGAAGAAAAAEILETPHLDAAFIGPVDLSHALGVPGQIDHPRVVAKIEEILDKARSLSVATAIFSPTSEGARRWLERGVTMVAVGVDSGHVLGSLREVIPSVLGPLVAPS